MFSLCSKFHGYYCYWFFFPYTFFLHNSRFPKNGIFDLNSIDYNYELSLKDHVGCFMFILYVDKYLLDLVVAFNAFGEHEKYKPRFCFHIAEFVMCRQPHQKSGCKHPRISIDTTLSTECFAVRKFPWVCSPPPARGPLTETRQLWWACSNLSLSLEGTLTEE